MKVIRESDFVEEVKKGLVLIDFYAEWCRPCKMLSPLLEEINDENDNVKVVKVNIDDSARIANLFRISSIPTLVLLRDGEVINRMTGFYPKKKIEELIENSK